MWHSCAHLVKPVFAHKRNFNLTFTSQEKLTFSGLLPWAVVAEELSFGCFLKKGCLCSEIDLFRVVPFRPVLRRPLSPDLTLTGESSSESLLTLVSTSSSTGGGWLSWGSSSTDWSPIIHHFFTGLTPHFSILLSGWHLAHTLWRSVDCPPSSKNAIDHHKHSRPLRSVKAKQV